MQIDEGLDRVVVGVIDDPVQGGANAQALRDNGEFVEFGGEFLAQFGAAEAEDSVDATGIEDVPESLQSHSRFLQPQRLEAIAQFGGPMDHAVVEARQVKRFLPGAKRVVEGYHPEAGRLAQLVGFAQVPHQGDNAGVGTVAQAPGQAADAQLRGAGDLGAVVEGQRHGSGREIGLPGDLAEVHVVNG